MRKTAFLIACGALALVATGAIAQDRYQGRDDRHDRRDDRRDDRRGGGGGVVLFEHDGFNDRVSSMRISRGAWEFCEHVYYRGKCWRYDYDTASLPKKQNDRFSSVRRVR